MVEELPAHAILNVMFDFAKQASDVPIETLCILFATLLADPQIQALDENLFIELVTLGAGLWRHSDGFRDAGVALTRQ
ncbi:hypothetical protein IAG41_11345 [Sphingomonas sp. JC676]|uniref:hypothetical protein n=1 Tax=Sphingomonas sp. JC676 TaxID=2768065 RepID=UPI0016586AE8|nr:hypothetical protein [Sphingomonas sp. JC676]MBC9032990.1 hypothetical protein [Sphingomonas sp. JC676]